MALTLLSNEEDKYVYNEIVNVAAFIQSWTEMSNFDFANKSTEKEHIKTMMNLDDEDFNILAERCSEKSLICGMEDQLKHQTQNYLPSDINLATVKLQKIELEKRRKSEIYKSLIIRKQKDRSLFSPILYPTSQQKKSSQETTLAPDAILQVAFYKPGKKLGNFISRCLGHTTANLENVYAVLGQQKLTELRDRIRCVNDVLVTGDYSDNPDINISVCAWDVFKSGTFFIENTFYDDTRQPDNLKYSKEIVEWAAELGVEYPCKIMEDTKFNELSVRIGCPYLYLHQGNCEHLLVFSDIRMLHPHDKQDINEYPCLLHRSNKKRTICRVCAYASARWRTVDSEHALENTSFFCDACFRSLHYDQNGKKLGNFKAYKYFDEHTVL